MEISAMPRENSDLYLNLFVVNKWSVVKKINNNNYNVTVIKWGINVKLSFSFISNFDSFCCGELWKPLEDIETHFHLFILKQVIYLIIL